MQLLIVGAGGHGHVVREIAESTKKYDGTFSLTIIAMKPLEK